jgi:hypothetical protein
MKTSILVFVFCFITQAHAETVITNQGTYVINQSSSTTYVTGPRSSSGSLAVAVPVTVNPVTGIGQVHTPQGSYLVQRSGSTTTVIQTSKGK